MRHLKRLPVKAIETVRLATTNALVLQWATEGIVSRNWGDKLNPYLVERISGRPVVHRADILPIPILKIFYAIGSHLSTACASPQSVVWGPGFISATVDILGKPQEVHAVRGWLSVERLRKAKVDCPDIVGDPALLLPRFYQPKPARQRFGLGIIPHCFEWNEHFFRRTRQWDDTLVIDICGEVEDVVDQIASCERIASSSLHGIICADAYGVPSIWLHASDKVKGDGFKFRDYFSSVGRSDRNPVIVQAESTKEEVLDQFENYEINIDLDNLLAACPFKAGLSSQTSIAALNR